MIRSDISKNNNLQRANGALCENVRMSQREKKLQKKYIYTMTQCHHTRLYIENLNLFYVRNKKTAYARTSA